MERPASGSAGARQANRNRTRHLGPPMQGGGLVDDLVESDRREVSKLHLDDWAHTLDRGAHGHADYRVLGYRRINDAAREFLRQVFRRLEGTAKCADVLAVYEHPRIIRQGASLGFADGLEIGDAH